MTPATEVPEGAIVRRGFGIADLLTFPARYDEAPALPRRADVIHGRQFQILRLWAGFGIVGYLPPELRRAGEDDHDVIVGLIDAAAQWLRATKDTDQWTQPWRSEEDRSNRIRRDLTAGKTWLLLDNGIAVATITADGYARLSDEQAGEYARAVVEGRAVNPDGPTASPGAPPS